MSLSKKITICFTIIMLTGITSLMAYKADKTPDYGKKLDLTKYHNFGEMQLKLNNDANMIVCFRTDKDSKYGVMSDVMRQLQDIGALKVNFETQMKTE